ncbi:MAG: hypothetical protein KGL39_19040 [Patescibacteria group bacterium]|nr:hypothetical protein [Patescibacteria group bacterium]
MAKDQFSDLSTKCFRRYQQMARRRDGWKTVYMLLSKYILMRPVWFGDYGVPGQTPLLNVAYVSDDTVVDAARTSATALGGALWPNTAETFELAPQIPHGMPFDVQQALDSEEVRQYMMQATKVVQQVIDMPESGFHIAWGEYLDDQIVFGTSGICADEDDKNDEVPIHFKTISVETSVIDEGKDRMVDCVGMEFVYTARQVVDIYGIENVSEKTRGLYEAEKYDDWIKVIQLIEPRINGKVGAPVTEKPYASIHFEYDNKHILLNSGMDERCIFVTRFRKRPNEVYGRSLAMDALPSVKELNILRRGMSKALDKILDPPLGFYSDQIGGSGQIDISAGARVPLNAVGKIPQGQSPIMQLLKINEPQVAKDRTENLEEKISVKFLIDRLLDFNNKTRMTLGEAELRNDFRNQALGNIFSRQIIELLNPLIKFVVNVLWRRGMLGLHPVRDAHQIAFMKAVGLQPWVIPNALAALSRNGKAPFKVHMISPAARAMRADSLVGIEKLTNYALTLMNGGATDVMDNVDTDVSIREYQKICGAPSKVLRGQDDMQKLRKQRQAAQAAQYQAQQGEIQANITAKGAKAAKDLASVGLPATPGASGLPGVAGLPGMSGLPTAGPAATTPWESGRLAVA